MTGSAQPPLLFLDVDGPLIPFGATPQQYPDGYPTYPVPEPQGANANPLLARINPAHGPRLAALPCDLVWATTWMADANEHVAPRLGLPQLAVVIWPESSDQEEQEEQEEQDERDGLHWKTRALVDWAAGRSFTWVDDEITDTDRAWVSTHHPGHALLHRVDPRHGLTESDFVTLDDWLRRTYQAPPSLGAAETCLSQPVRDTPNPRTSRDPSSSSLSGTGVRLALPKPKPKPNAKAGSAELKVFRSALQGPKPNSIRSTEGSGVVGATVDLSLPTVRNEEC